MKNYVKAIVTFVFVMAAVAMMPNVADAAVTSLAAPTNLRQIAADDDSVTFQWNAVIGADDYEYRYSDGISTSEWDSVYSTEKTIWNLSSGCTYYVQVRARNDGDDYWENTDDVYSPESALLEVVTAPKSSEFGLVKTTAVTENSISFTWNQPAGATSYEVVNNDAIGAVLATLPAGSGSVTVGNLTPATWYDLRVIAYRTSSTGFRASSGKSGMVYERTAGTAITATNTGTVVTAPGTPSTANFTISNASSSTRMVSFYAADPTGRANGYEIEVRKIKGNKRVKTIDSRSSYSTSVKFSKNTPYKYRIRFYALSGTNKLYSGWSGYRHFCIQNVTGKRVYSSRSKYAPYKLKWGKVTGAKGYTVYISTSKDGKYKKVKSLGKNAKKITVTKYGKKKLSRYKTYYIKVVAKVKDGGKTIKNDTQLYNYR